MNKPKEKTGPGWFEFSDDYDHRWPEGAVTAFKAGQKVHIKREVIDSASSAEAGKEIDKPADDDPARIATPTNRESNRRRSRIFAGNPVKVGGAVQAGGRRAGTRITGKHAALAETSSEPLGGTVTGERLSPASGGDGEAPADDRTAGQGLSGDKANDPDSEPTTNLEGASDKK